MGYSYINNCSDEEDPGAGGQYRTSPTPNTCSPQRIILTQATQAAEI